MTKLFKSINISLVVAVIMILATALNLAEEVRLTTVIGVAGNEVRGAFGVIGNPPEGAWTTAGWQTWQTYDPGNDWLVVGQGLSVGNSELTDTFSVNGTALVTGTVTLVQGLNVTTDVNIGDELSVSGTSITTNGILSFLSGRITGSTITGGVLFANSDSIVINGPIYRWVTIQEHGYPPPPDYVFEPDYKLETIEKHAEFMWEKKRLPAIPTPEKTDDGIYRTEIGGQQRGILEELEKAHIYIAQLKEMIYKLKKRVIRLENKCD